MLTHLSIVFQKQAVVDLINFVESDGTSKAPDYSKLIDTPLLDSDTAKELLNDVLEDVDPSDVNTIDELKVLLTIVDKIEELIKGTIPAPVLTAAELDKLGLEGATPENIAEIIEAIKDTGTIPSKDELQDIINEVIGNDTNPELPNPLDIITNYADVSTNPVPSVNDYAKAGITGVDADNISDVNSFINSLPKTGASCC